MIDVFIPAYGDGSLLRAAVDSVLAQTASGWRLTVVDDGPSDDELAAWLLERGDDRVRYLHNPQNLGITANFQRCVELAELELVVLLGADDRLLPTYVETIKTARRDWVGAAFIQPGVRVIDDAGNVVRPLGDRVKSALRPKPNGARLLGGEALLASLLRGNWMYFPSVAFDRKWLQRFGFRPQYAVVQDLDLYLRMLLEGAQLLLLDEVCFEYRRHSASLSSTEAATGGRFEEELAFFAEARALATELGWTRAARAAALHPATRLHALVRATSAVRAGDRQAARSLTRLAARRLRE